MNQRTARVRLAPLDLPELPDPPDVVSAQCPNRSPSAPCSQGAEQARRPKQHDMATLVTASYLERLGFQYRPATAASTFRHPHQIEAPLRKREAREGWRGG